MVFHWSLSDSKSPQISRTHLRILAVFNNAVIWIVSTCPPTSTSSRPFNNPLVIVPNAPITIGTIVTFMFPSFFNSLARSWYLSFFAYSFRFILWSTGTAKSKILQILFFFVDYYKVWSSGTSVRLSDSKFPRVSRTLLSILVDLSNAVVCMVFTRPVVSKSSTPCINPLVTVPTAPITIGVTVTFMFHFFSVLKQGVGPYLSFRFLSVLLCGQQERQSQLFCLFSFFSFFLFFFLLTITRSGRLAEIIIIISSSSSSSSSIKV